MAVEALEVLDPTAEREPADRPLAGRRASLKGATVGLLDINKERGHVFLDELERLLRQRGTVVERHAKPTHTHPAPEDLRARVAARCDAVIEALAD